MTLSSEIERLTQIILSDPRFCGTLEQAQEIAMSHFVMESIKVHVRKDEGEKV